MVLLLLISLVALLILCFIFFRFDLTSPSILLIGPYIVSVIFLLLNKNEWQLSISEITFYVVFFGLFATLIGEVLARFVIQKTIKRTYPKNCYITISQPSAPKNYFTNIAIFYLFFFTVYYALHIQSVVSESLVVNESMLGAYRSIEKNEGLMLKLFLAINLPLAYFFLFSFAESYVLRGSARFKLLIPVFLYALTSILSSSRIGILYLLISSILFFFILYQRKVSWRADFNLKIVTLILVCLMITVGLFYFLGFLTGKSTLHSFFYIISLYIGSSVAALDSFLIGFHYNFNEFGSETLVGLSNLFSLVGLDVGFAGERILDFVHLGEMPSRTNVYTSFRRVANDYGFLGVGIYQFIVGFIFAFLYQCLRIKKGFRFKFWVMIYVYFAQYLVLSFVDERLILNVFSATTIIQVFLIFVFTRGFSNADASVRSQSYG